MKTNHYYLLYSITFVFFVVPYGMAQQQDDTVLFRAYYTLYHVRDTSQKDKLHTEEMVLLANKSTSSFISYDKIKQRVGKFQELREMSRNSTERLPTLSASPGKIVTAQEIFREIGSPIFKVKDFLSQYYEYEETIPRINWAIQEDSVGNVAGVECVKAIAFVKGREWHVWFAPDIPFPVGPWFLGDLPGLIVLAKDKGGEVSFELTSFQQAAEKDAFLEENVQIAPFAQHYTESKAVSKNDFFTLRNRALKNPEAFRKAQAAVVMGIQDYGLLNSQSWISVIQNPINLNERNH